MKLIKRDKYKSAAYWTQLIQLSLFDSIKRYLEANGISRTEFAHRLGVSKGYVSQIMNGEFDHKLSKLSELALACDMVPRVELVPLKYAVQVVEDAYLQPVDWTVEGEYRNTSSYQNCLLPAAEFSALSKDMIRSSCVLGNLEYECFTNGTDTTAINDIA